MHEPIDSAIEIYETLSVQAKDLCVYLVQLGDQTLVRTPLKDILLFHVRDDEDSEDDGVNKLIRLCAELLDRKIVSVIGGGELGLGSRIQIESTFKQTLMLKVVRPQRRFQELLQLRRSAQLLENDVWGYDEEQLADYEAFFSQVLEGASIRGLVETIRERKGKVQVANILGGTTMLEELNPDSGYAMRLQKKKESENNNIKAIYGSILSKKKWAELPANQDLIISMGRAAYLHLTAEPEIWRWLLNQCWQKLSQDGVLLLQVPIFLADELKKIKSEWDAIGGIQSRTVIHTNDSVDHDDYIELMLLKTAQAPPQL